MKQFYVLTDDLNRPVCVRPELIRYMSGSGTTSTDGSEMTILHFSNSNKLVIKQPMLDLFNMFNGDRQ